MTILHKFLFVFAASCVPAAAAQSPDAAGRPSFDVASVRQNKSGGPQHSNIPLDSGNVYSAINPGDARTSASGYFVATSQPLWRFIAFAYKLSGTQELALRFNLFGGLKSNAPKWVTGGFDVSADVFNIEARAAANSTVDQMRLMMQSLLAERFQLVMHRESREAPAFGLLLVRPGRLGATLQAHPATDVCSASAANSDMPAPPSSASAGWRPAAGLRGDCPCRVFRRSA